MIHTRNIVVELQLAEIEERAKKKVLLNPKERSEFVRRQQNRKEIEKLKIQIQRNMHMFG